MIALLLILSIPFQLIQKDIVSVQVPELTIQAGKTGTITILINVKDGYHIQSNKTKDEFLIPTTIEIENNKYFETGKAAFPSTKKFRLQGTEEDLDVFGNYIEVKIPLQINTMVKKGNHSIRAKLKYQACDERTCLAPKTIDFIINLHIIDVTISVQTLSLNYSFTQHFRDQMAIDFVNKIAKIIVVGPKYD
jgi:DsbC/DsbD-like thiol-disulfide interchange protein